VKKKEERKEENDVKVKPVRETEFIVGRKRARIELSNSDAHDTVSCDSQLQLETPENKRNKF